MREPRQLGALVWAPLIALLSSVGLAWALRLGLVEPAAMSGACAADPGHGGWCALRWLTIQAFIDQRLGAFALAAALLASVTRRRSIAAWALAAGGAGLVLYSAGLAAPATLLAALVLVRPAR